MLLHHVHARCRFQHRVQQQPLLHGSQRIQIFDRARLPRELIESCGIDTGQGKVGRRVPARSGLQAMGDDPLERGHIRIGELFDLLPVVEVFAVLPLQMQAVVEHIAGDIDRVRTQGLDGTFRAFLFSRGGEHVGLVRQPAIQLAEVVERDIRPRQLAERLANLVGAEIAKQAVADPLLGNPPQLLLDRLDQLPTRGRIRSFRAGPDRDS